MTASELQIIRDLLTAKPPPENPSIAHQRARFAKLATFLPTPEDATTEAVSAGGVPAEWISAPGSDSGRTILYLHGGGYCIGSIDTHRTLCYGLAAAAGARILSLGYRLAPEDPFPAAVEDAEAAYCWLISEGFDASQIALAGDSAGGGLVVAVSIALKQRGSPLPAAAVCFSPWVDLEGLGESMTTKADVDPMSRRPELLEFAAHYLNGTDPRNPVAAPLYADLSGLPPLLIQTGTAEIFLDDSRRLAKRAKAAGVDTTLDVWDDMIHVWQLFAPMLSEGRDAIKEAGAFIRARMDG